MVEDSLLRLIKMIESLEEEKREFYHGNDEAGTSLRDKLKSIKGKLRECVEKNVLRSPTRKEIYKQYKDINQINEKHKEEI